MCYNQILLFRVKLLFTTKTEVVETKHMLFSPLVLLKVLVFLCLFGNFMGANHKMIFISNEREVLYIYTFRIMLLNKGSTSMPVMFLLIAVKFHT